MKDYHTALVYGTLSAVTLPLGAIFGILTTVPQSTIAMGIAFGAGALLFAVTVELYGSAIERLERREYNEHNVNEVIVTACGAVVGAVLYILLCRWLDKALEDLDLQDLQQAKEDLQPDRAEDVRVPSIDCLGVSSASMGTSLETTPRDSEWPPPISREGSRRRASARTYSDDDEEVPIARGRKKAVLGVLQPGQVDKAMRRAHFRSHSPSPASYGTMTLSARERYYEDVYNEHKKAQRNCSMETFNDLRVAGGIWLGVLLDGIPEAIMLGYLAAEYKLTFALVAALLIANFPESFSSAALLYRRGVAAWKIIMMWLFLCMFTGIIACITAYSLPSNLVNDKGRYKDRYVYLQFVGAVVEGMAGGAMLACISNIMLPEAFKHRGDMAGMAVLVGFLVATMIKVFGGVIQEELVE